MWVMCRKFSLLAPVCKQREIIVAKAHSLKSLLRVSYGNLIGGMLDDKICCMLSTDTDNGIPEVIILDPAGHKTTVPVKMRKISHNRWKCEYVSNIIGLHSVNIFFGGVPVKKSPFGVKIASSM